MFKTQELSRKTRMQWLAFVLLTAVMYQVIFLAWVTEGFQAFTYTLDDPYIHLKLAKNIASGHYGFNLSENSAPSSSIVWPFLLAPFAHTYFFEYVPFVFNSVLILCFVAVVFDLLVNFQIRPAVSYTISILLLFFINGFGLALNGLEHVLQLLLVALIFKQFAEIVERRQESFGQLVGLLTFAIMIRYEMLVFWAAAVAFYLTKRDPKKICIVTLFPLFPAVAFSFFLKWIGLGFLPSSVMAKTASDTSFLLTVLSTFHANATSRQGLGILLLTIINVLLARKTHRLSWASVTVLVIPSVLHLLVGKFGWFFRYEVYILVYVILFFISLLSVSNLSRWRYILSFAFLCWLCEPYIFSLSKLHQASRNIRFQQGVTAEFMDKYLKEPVGLNDIGLPGLRYKYEVLDLWGLASQDALRKRLSSRDFDWISDIANEKGVDILFIYESWLQPSAEWKKVGEFILLEKNVVLGGDVVSVFTREEKISKLKNDLISFKGELGNLPVEVKIY
ncbi:hypothetical protein AZI85_16070 [Bdellovibrio bacteriovorus]|uniref:Glycosyltransferase RgtA/B/C/D-like domain-containing protein n=1 Tax=Bdellovibrio bacteriovorus TaxID=959 RepID=A0A150WTT1_BDEBC|nr:hypothetical protein [Bdellovibrio bacteriovorus]KYG69909.1 hypothetical protein AZI85_16070 [Bdellovibrio bacteriovorus]